VIENLPEGQVTLAEIRDALGPDGSLLLVLLLTPACIIPISLPGIGGLFGIALLLIGVSRLLGKTLWLPRRMSHRAFASDKVRVALSKGSLWLHKLERLSVPYRMRFLVTDGLSGSLNNSALILGSLLLMTPWVLIPFSNSLPGLALLLLSVGMLQRDGLFICLGHVFNLLTIIYFTALLIGGGAVIHATIDHVEAAKAAHHAAKESAP
jgi:hypothetical protein